MGELTEECDLVISTHKLHTPVRVSIASSGVVGGTVEVGVADSDSQIWALSKTVMLSAKRRCRDMVDPDEICVTEDDGITSPDIHWIQVGNLDVLDDDIRYTGHA